ncbi:MAG: T9SS type A sorting domain-containing protein [Candidatus Eisenbacteria bacterium]
MRGATESSPRTFTRQDGNVPFGLPAVAHFNEWTQDVELEFGTDYPDGFQVRWNDRDCVPKVWLDHLEEGQQGLYQIRFRVWMDWDEDPGHFDEFWLHETDDSFITTYDYDVPDPRAVDTHRIRVEMYGYRYTELGYNLRFMLDYFYEARVVGYPERTYRSPEGDALVGFLSPDGVLDRPIVFIEGIDDGDHRMPAFYFDRLGAFFWSGLDPDATGYDIFVYNYDESTQSMRDNAMGVLGALLEIREDAITESGGAADFTRVLGHSMGGVVGRYALAWAEEFGYEHGCDMFLSGDAPQQGAWVSTELQNWVQLNLDESGHSTIPFLNRFVDLFEKQASLELIRVNKFDPDPLPPGGDPEIDGHTQYETFFHELNALNSDGWPRETVNIGASFGRGHVESVDGSSGGRIEATYDWEEAFSIVALEISGLALFTLPMTAPDKRPGSYQPEFRDPQEVQGEVPVFDTSGLGFFSRFIGDDPITLEFGLTFLNPTVFIWANSALDLWDVDWTDAETTIDGWDRTGFDEIYIQEIENDPIPREEQFHDVFPGLIATTMLQKLRSSVSLHIDELPRVVETNEIVDLVASVSGYGRGNVSFYLERTGQGEQLLGTVALDGPYHEGDAVSLDWAVDPSQEFDVCRIRARGPHGTTATSNWFSIVSEIGPNNGGTLILHSNETLVYTSEGSYCGQAGIESCEDANVDRDGSYQTILTVLAAFPQTPSLAGVSFGVSYEDPTITIVEHGPCGDTEVPTSSWPESGWGTSVYWDTPQTDPLVEVYWMVAHHEPDILATEFQLTRHRQGLGGYFEDGSVPPVRDPIRDFGTFGFGLHPTGDLPCPSREGACCIDVGICQIATPVVCADLGGVYLGSGRECDPAGCGPNAGGTLVFHAPQGLTYQEGNDYCDLSGVGTCADVDTRVDGGDTAVVYVLADLSSASIPALSSVSFGVSYDSNALQILDVGGCGASIVTGNDWPASMSAVEVAWDTPRTDALVEVCWIAVRNIGTEPERLELVPHVPQGGAYLRDDADPPHADRVLCLGGLGFGQDGFVCCDREPAAVPEFQATRTMALWSPNPNPASERASVRFVLPNRSRTEVSVYDVHGRQVRSLLDQWLDSGEYDLHWDTLDDRGRAVASGVYYIRARVDDRSVGRKLVVAR